MKEAVVDFRIGACDAALHPGAAAGQGGEVYSERLMALFHSARHAGALVGATHRGVGGTPGGGPYLVLSFRVEAGVVQEARYKTYGCPAAIACAEAACAWSEHQTLKALTSATPAAITEWVGGVPEGKEHCPELAARALTEVVAQP